jgi:hypothetical protein
VWRRDREKIRVVLDQQQQTCLRRGAVTRNKDCLSLNHTEPDELSALPMRNKPHLNGQTDIASVADYKLLSPLLLHVIDLQP